MNGAYPEALAKYDQIIKIDPKFAPAFAGIGNIYATLAFEEETKTGKTKLLQKAVAQYDQAIKLDSENSAAYYGRGSVYREMQNFTKAVDDYSNAIKFNHDENLTEILFYSRAGVYCKAGMKDLAIADAQKVLDSGGFIGKPCR